MFIWPNWYTLPSNKANPKFFLSINNNQLTSIGKGLPQDCSKADCLVDHKMSGQFGDSKTTSLTQFDHFFGVLDISGSITHVMQVGQTSSQSLWVYGRKNHGWGTREILCSSFVSKATTPGIPTTLKHCWVRIVIVQKRSLDVSWFNSWRLLVNLKCVHKKCVVWWDDHHSRCFPIVRIPISWIT